MKPEETFERITAQEIRLKSESSAEVPKSLESLNELRYRIIPQALRQRKNDGNVVLEKSELVNLVEWKL